MATITLSGHYGYQVYQPDLADGTTIDASRATFTVDNNIADDGKALENPVSIRDAANITISGGTILGVVDQKTERADIYKFDPGNSPALYARDAPNVHISGWRIDKAWDGIRTSYNSDGFLIEDVWITNIRDDAFENDKLNSGVIRDSLFDGVFAGISLDPSTGSNYDGAGKDVVIDGVLIRMKTFLSGGMMNHNSPLKLDVNLEMPDLHITNSVFAIEYVNHGGDERLAYAWENLVESSGNVFLNLSDDPLPDDYPMPPKGWKVLQGQAARDYWENARDKWVAEHADMAIPGDDVPSNVPGDPGPKPDPEEPKPNPEEPKPVPNPEGDATFAGTTFRGGDHGETIIGNVLDNDIDGDNGNDVIHGRGGNDVLRGDGGTDKLWGGAGNDVFLFKRASDSRAGDGFDTIMDFTRGDRIALGQIDANRDASGDQAFVLTKGAAGLGELSVRYDSGAGMTVIDANVDNDSAAELTLYLAGKHTLTADDFVL